MELNIYKGDDSMENTAKVYSGNNLATSPISTDNSNIVYLAGSINGLSYEGATNWREDLGEFLTMEGYNVLSPMRFKGTLKGVTTISDRNTAYSAHNILKRDLQDIGMSSVIIANLEGIDERPSIGTLMELGIALEQGKQVIFFNAPKDLADHPFLHLFYNANTWTPNIPINRPTLKRQILEILNHINR